jgi:hypothetical protein
MTSVLSPIAGRIAQLIRLLSSDRDGEVIAAARALGRTLHGAGLDVHSLAEQIEKGSGSFNETEARKLYDAGYEQGYQAGTSANGREGFHDISSPLATWHETAHWCQQHSEQLRPREHEFVDQMTAQTLWREPTERQGRWLKSIYHRLGGK